MSQTVTEIVEEALTGTPDEAPTTRAWNSPQGHLVVSLSGEERPRQEDAEENTENAEDTSAYPEPTERTWPDNVPAPQPISTEGLPDEVTTYIERIDRFLVGQAELESEVRQRLDEAHESLRRHADNWRRQRRQIEEVASRRGSSVGASLDPLLERYGLSRHQNQQNFTYTVVYSDTRGVEQASSHSSPVERTSGGCYCPSTDDLKAIFVAAFGGAGFGGRFTAENISAVYLHDLCDNCQSPQAAYLNS